VPAIYNEDPEQEIQPTKIHLRGIDELSTDQVREFAIEHFSTPPKFVQWIDDSSANIVYPNSELALDALRSLSADPPSIAEAASNPLQLRDTKPRPGCHLQVRRAVVGDKKKPNAKEASRYYLLHPEADPIERMRAEFANGRGRRDRDHGDYQRRRYNDREDRRRRDLVTANGEGGDFNASMYDDNPEPRQAPGRGDGRGRRRARDRSASPGRSTTNSDEIDLVDDSVSENENGAFRRRNKPDRFRDRSLPPRYSVHDPHPFPKANREKELFPSNTDTKSGQLASDMLHAKKQAERQAAAAKLKRELFPNKTDRSNHRRSDAFDARAAADAANSDDLSRRMTGRMDLADTPTITTSENTNLTNTNAGKELFLSTNTNGRTSTDIGPSPGLTIKGTAGLSIKGTASPGLIIKGGATATTPTSTSTSTTAPRSKTTVRELFPNKFINHAPGPSSDTVAAANENTNTNSNQGKELFTDKIRGRGSVRRNRAEDLFW
jgi:Nuclear cap-binding protein subunit 3